MERHKLYYDWKAHCMDMVVGDIVLVHQKVFGTTYNIEDQWEIPVYIVLAKTQQWYNIQGQKDWQ